MFSTHHHLPHKPAKLICLSCLFFSLSFLFYLKFNSWLPFCVCPYELHTSSFLFSAESWFSLFHFVARINLVSHPPMSVLVNSIQTCTCHISQMCSRTPSRHPALPFSPFYLSLYKTPPCFASSFWYIHGTLLRITEGSNVYSNRRSRTITLSHVCGSLYWFQIDGDQMVVLSVVFLFFCCLFLLPSWPTYHVYLSVQRNHKEEPNETE